MSKEKNGSYDLEGVIWHQHSNKLMVAILELWPNKAIPILDFGCGHNFYTNVLKYAGYAALGIDNTELKGVDLIYDITEPITLLPFLWNKSVTKSKTNIISLEVGEHIPIEKSDDYLDNITKYHGDIIMSWALPGQAGVGHINNRPYEWVTSKMFDRGYIIDADKTVFLRNAVDGCRCDWFKNTLMYFKPNVK